MPRVLLNHMLSILEISNHDYAQKYAVADIPSWIEATVQYIFKVMS